MCCCHDVKPAILSAWRRYTWGTSASEQLHALNKSTFVCLQSLALGGWMQADLQNIQNNENKTALGSSSFNKAGWH